MKRENADTRLRSSLRHKRTNKPTHTRKRTKILPKLRTLPPNTNLLLAIKIKTNRSKTPSRKTHPNQKTSTKKKNLPHTPTRPIRRNKQTNNVRHQPQRSPHRPQRTNASRPPTTTNPNIRQTIERTNLKRNRNKNNLQNKSTPRLVKPQKHPRTIQRNILRSRKKIPQPTRQRKNIPTNHTKNRKNIQRHRKKDSQHNKRKQSKTSQPRKPQISLHRLEHTTQPKRIPRTKHTTTTNNTTNLRKNHTTHSHTTRSRKIKKFERQPYFIGIKFINNSSNANWGEIRK